MEARRTPRSTWRPTPFLAASAGLHVAALAVLAVAPRHWRLACGAVLADHAAIAAAGLWPRGRLLGPNLSRLPAEAALRGEVALTFDDGPDRQATPGVLDLLDRYGARATFFCIGRRAAALRELAAEIAHRGHRLENHSHTHSPAFSLYPPWAIAREVALAQEELERAAGAPPRYFRAPAGFRNLWLDPVLAAAGLHLVSWTRRAFDTVRSRAAGIAADLLRGLAAGDVLLLHDGSAARAPGGGPVVLEALPRVLDGIAVRGFRAVPFAGAAHSTGAAGTAGERPG